LIDLAGERGGGFADVVHSGEPYGERACVRLSLRQRLGHLGPVEFEEEYYVEQPAVERANLKPRQPVLTS
jgi:hypothetical protein